MYTCPKCNFNSESAMNFCPRCGSAVTHREYAVVTEAAVPDQIADTAPAQATYTAPVQPTYYNPVSYSPAPVNKPNLAKKIVGMSLSITGFVFAMFAALFSLVAFDEYSVDMAFGMTLYFSLLGLPGSIIGFIFSNAARNSGDTSSLSRVGRSLGLAGIIVMGISLLMTFIALIVTA